jgi:uncharacterized protein YkwD
MAIATRQKKSTHHKKRSAAHHKRSKRYMHTYFPYIPMLMIAGFGLWINAALSHPQVLGSSTDFSAETLLLATNDARSNNSAVPLKLNTQLSQAAQAKADDMVTRNYWSHTAPDGTTPVIVVTSHGYAYQATGENLAYGFSSAGQVIKGWLNSPEHRLNLLSNQYEDVGFGVASSANYLGKGPETVVVAEYGEPSDAVANISFSVDNPNRSAVSGQVKGSQTELQSQKVSRIALLTDGRAAWSYVLVSALAGAAIAIFLIHNSLRIHRLLSRGEEFVVKHPWFDISVVFVATACLLLSRTAGLIR